MQTILIVIGASLILGTLTAIGRWVAGLILPHLPTRLRDTLVMPHTERKDWLLVWLPWALWIGMGAIIWFCYPDLH